MAGAARVVDRADSGLRLIAPDEQSIGDRYRPGSWSWVVVAGGGNDLAMLPGVDFVDGREAVSPERNPGAYQADGMRPAPEGAERLARALHDAMFQRVGSER